MKKIKITIIIILLTVSTVSFSYAAVNLEVGGSIVSRPMGTGSWTDLTVKSGIIGTGIDLGKLSRSAMIQLRLDFSFADFLTNDAGQADYAWMGILFIGTRFYFANHDVPLWLAPFFEIGWEPRIQKGIYSGSWQAGDLEFNFAAFAIGMGCEFYVWKKLYLALNVRVHLNEFSFFSFSPIIGYRF